MKSLKLSFRSGRRYYFWHERGDSMSDIILNPDEKEVFRLFTDCGEKGLN
jgi:hypothetical protein